MRLLLCLLLISCSSTPLPKVGTCYTYSLPDLNPSYGTQRNPTINYLYKYSEDRKFVYFRPGGWNGLFYEKVNSNWKTNYSSSNIGVMKTQDFLKLLEMGARGGFMQLGESSSNNNDSLAFKCSNRWFKK